MALDFFTLLTVVLFFLLSRSSDPEETLGDLFSEETLSSGTSLFFTKQWSNSLKSRGV
jgi:hypothetical protein